MNTSKGKLFLNIIRDETEKLFKCCNQNTVNFRQGEIVQVNSTTNRADIKISTMGTILENIMNKSGESLNIGDQVMLCILDSNLSNSYINTKL